MYIKFNEINIERNTLDLRKGETNSVTIETLPDWLAGLDEEDLSFIKKFLLSSGSLKEVAQLYGVTYPTVRLRLDRLIQKIRLNDDTAAEPYVTLIKRLAMNDKLDFDTAKLLITEYKKTQKEGSKL